MDTPSATAPVPPPGSLAPRRIAVIVVHGVAAEKPMAAAESVAEMLTSFDARGAEYKNVSREDRRIEVKTIYPASAPLPDQPQPTSGESPDPQSIPWLQESFKKASSFQVPEQDKQFRTFALSTRRVPYAPEEPAIHVDLFEAYWGDITRATKYTFLKSVLALYLLLFDLGLLAHQALKEALSLMSVGPGSDHPATGKQQPLHLTLQAIVFCQHILNFFNRNGVPVLNLVILACALGAFATNVEEKAARWIASAITGSLVGLAIWTIPSSTWFKKIGRTLIAGILVSISAYLLFTFQVFSLHLHLHCFNTAFFYLLALLGIAFLGWRSSRLEFKIAAWLCSGIAAGLVLLMAIGLVPPSFFLDYLAPRDSTALLAGAEKAQAIMAVVAIATYIILSGIWIFANVLLGLFLLLGSYAFSLAPVRCRRAIATALGTQLCGTALVMLTTVSLWHLALLWLDVANPKTATSGFYDLFALPSGSWDGAQIALLSICHRLLELCYNPMTFLGIQAGVLFFIAIFLASLPFIQRELFPRPWDGSPGHKKNHSKASMEVGAATTDALGISFWAVLLFTLPVFGALAWGVLYLNFPWIVAIKKSLHISPENNPAYIPGMLPALAIGFGLLVAFFLKSALAVTVDVINWFRERPKNQTVWQRCTARFFAVLNFIATQTQSGRAVYDGIIIVAHSQGTMVATETLKLIHNYCPTVAIKGGGGTSRQIPFKLPPTYLLTMGSPLRQLYCERFPERYCWVDSVDGPPNDLGVERWVNLYGAADYVGRNLWSTPDHPFAIGHHPDSNPPAERVDICLGETAHTHYWDLNSRAVAEQLDQAITALAKN